MIDNLWLGLQYAATWANLWYCFVGVFLGTLVGVLPGVGPLATIALLLPFTFSLDATSAVIMLAGVYYGGAYGGSTTAILLNVPGSASAAVTCLDGYPMARQGRGGIALLGCAAASWIGASIGIIIMMFASEPIANFALEFGPSEYVAMMTMGLIASATISGSSPMKGIAMTIVGVLFGLVGTDVNSGTVRYAFGVPELSDGIGLSIIAMAIFGITEMIASVKTVSASDIDPNAVTFRSMVPTKDDVKRFWAPTIRGSLIGSFFGALPGTGALISCFAAYAVEKNIAKDKSRFGKGAIEGVVGPEAANNACDQTAFIPTMTLGIPGTATMALIIGALMIQGIAPGPQLVLEKPQLFWGLIMSFWIGNVMLVILNIPLIGIWLKLLAVPYHILYPIIMSFICIGAYSINNNPWDIWVCAAFGLVGYAFRILDLPPAPLILGYVLGPLLEEYLRRAMLLSRGQIMPLLERPIAGTMFAVTTLLVLWTIYVTLRGRKQSLISEVVDVSALEEIDKK